MEVLRACCLLVTFHHPRSSLSRCAVSICHYISYLFCSIKSFYCVFFCCNWNRLKFIQQLVPVHYSDWCPKRVYSIFPLSAWESFTVCMSVFATQNSTSLFETITQVVLVTSWECCTWQIIFFRNITFILKYESLLRDTNFIGNAFNRNVQINFS